MSQDGRDERIAELETENAELRARVEQLTRRLLEVEALLRRLTGKNDPRQKEKQPERPTKGKDENVKRRAGAQPGHPKHERPLAPPEQVDERHDCVPHQCAHCAATLLGRDVDPLRHQVFHLPEVRPRIVEYLLHALVCWRCGRVTRAELPAGVPRGAFGPSVVAAVALLMGAYRLGKRSAQMLMRDFFGLTMSLGAVVDCQNQASDALHAPYDEAAEHARKQKLKYADETSWRQKKQWVWLWTVATSAVVVFKIQTRRSAEAARKFLGKAVGILITDRGGMYEWWTLWARQVCWAHLVRDFAKIAARGGESAPIGSGLLDLGDELFRYFHRVRDGTLKRETFRRYMLVGGASVQARVRALLEQGIRCAQPRTARTCQKLLAVFPAMWTFVETPGLEPTNNEAERSLRHGVIWRKLSHGTQSDAGSRFVERILTAVATLRKQERDVLAFLRDACEARLTHSAPPSLLPDSSSQLQAA